MVLGPRAREDWMSTYRILSIDGGGARGMIPAVILKEIERRADAPIHKLFDRVVGTSTGSILACGMTVPAAPGSSSAMYTAEAAVELYRSLGREIFSRGSLRDRLIQPMEELAARSHLWIGTHPAEVISFVKDALKNLTNPLHDVNKLAYVLHEKFGNAKLEDALADLFVYTYDTGSRTVEIMGKREPKVQGATRDYSEYRMYQAATASSAASPFFAPFKVWQNPNPPTTRQFPGIPIAVYPEVGGTGDGHVLIDGGCGGIGNPALLAYIEPRHLPVEGPTLLLSLGTGHFEAPIDYNTSKGWGILEWVVTPGELLGCVFDGASDATDMSLRTIMHSEDEPYYRRWQAALPREFAFLDEGSASDMDALEDFAQALISEKDEEIDWLVAELKKPRIMRAPNVDFSNTPFSPRPRPRPRPR
jgi:predicted acylesterase/phospholipase RssA